MNRRGHNGKERARIIKAKTRCIKELYQRVEIAKFSKCLILLLAPQYYTIMPIVIGYMQKDIKNIKFRPGIDRIKYGGAVTGKEEVAAIQKVLDRNWWTLDEEGRLFEKELSEATGVKHAILTNSGSSALLLSILALNLPTGSEILVPACNFPTVVSSAYLAGLKVVYLDVDPLTYCLDLGVLEGALRKNPKVKAVVMVDIAGNVTDLKKFRSICKKYKVISIIDNCDGFGSTFGGKFVENYADVACTSFHAAHIITTGEGGAVFTNDKVLADRLRSMREWGRAADSDKAVKYKDLPSDYPSRYTYVTCGFNLKPIELQAAMGRVQLKKLQKIKGARANNFNSLAKGLSQFSEYITIAHPSPEAKVSWFSFPITLKKGKRANILKYLEKINIETRVIFSGNIVKQPAYKNLPYKISDNLTNAERILNNAFFISVHPSVTVEMIRYITESFKEYFKNGR